MKIDARDAIWLIGLVLMGVGSGMVYIPAGLIIPGVVMTAVSIWMK